MTEETKIGKDEILKVCTALQAFEKRQTDEAIRILAHRLRANLALAAAAGERPGFGHVLAEQAAALEQARKLIAA